MKKMFFLLVFSSILLNAQTSKKQFKLKDEEVSNVVMTWTKDTPEKEMQDDCKGLLDYGVTIKYSDVKRNSKNEITRIKMSFEDRKGNKGSLSYDGEKPISTIKFYKQDDQIGFGEPPRASMNSFLDNFMNIEGLNGLNFNFNDENFDTKRFNFTFPNDENLAKQKSKIYIQKDGKKPLVIEDGVVIEGSEDYTPEEIEEYKKSIKIESWNDDKILDLRNLEKNDDINKIKELLKSKSSTDVTKENEKEALDQATQEMKKAKEELEKARKELEDARKSLENTKTKTKKI